MTDRREMTADPEWIVSLYPALLELRCYLSPKFNFTSQLSSDLICFRAEFPSDRSGNNSEKSGWIMSPNLSHQISKIRGINICEISLIQSVCIVRFMITDFLFLCWALFWSFDLRFTRVSLFWMNDTSYSWQIRERICTSLFSSLPTLPTLYMCWDWELTPRVEMLSPLSLPTKREVEKKRKKNRSREEEKEEEQREEHTYFKAPPAGLYSLLCVSPQQWDWTRRHSIYDHSLSQHLVLKFFKTWSWCTTERSWTNWYGQTGKAVTSEPLGVTISVIKVSERERESLEIPFPAKPYGSQYKWSKYRLNVTCSWGTWEAMWNWFVMVCVWVVITDFLSLPIEDRFHSKIQSYYFDCVFSVCCKTSYRFSADVSLFPSSVNTFMVLVFVSPYFLSKGLFSHLKSFVSLYPL